MDTTNFGYIHIYINATGKDKKEEKIQSPTLLTLTSEDVQMSLILRQRPPKPYKLLKFFISFVTTVKSRHVTSIWQKLRWKSLCLPILKTIMEIIKILRVYMVFGDAVSKLETFVWILNPISRSITWSLFTLKTPDLVKWPILKWSFMWLCQIIDWLKYETRPSSLLNFGTAYYINFPKPYKYGCNEVV